MPYFLAFKVKAVVLVEIGLPSYQTAHFTPNMNDESLRSELDLLEEKREIANLRVATYK